MRMNGLLDCGVRIGRLLLFGVVLGCGPAESTSNDDAGRITAIGGKADDPRSALATGRVPRLPSAGGTGALSPWGGSDPARWRPEAILANATSGALNEAWALADVRDAVVAVPAKMYSSSYSEFGDGQLNAVPSLEWWRAPRPPVVATLVTFTNAPARVLLRFDRAHNLPSGALEVSYRAGGASRRVAITATKQPDGDYTAEWPVPGGLDLSLLSKQVLLVHPAGWADWFPIWFRFPVRTIASLKATVPAAMQRFADGGDIVDHERVSAQTMTTDGATPYERLSSRRLSFGYNQDPYNPQDIHARYPTGGASLVTGVGQGWTWVNDRPNAPFKIMYTCFEARRPDLEASAANGGVASGGGWHKIGDPAETILNDLEAGPLVVGSAMNNPTTLESGGFSYNLSDVVTVRFLHPGEAFATPAGAAGQAMYHWYYFHQAKNVCTEEWVHLTTPSIDTLDFAGPQTRVGFRIDNASTSWGQNVYVIGDVAALGAWDPQHAVKLVPASYPSWSGGVDVPAGPIQFKFIKMDGAGHVTWEGGANHSLDASVQNMFWGPWQ